MDCGNILDIRCIMELS